jgi:hypothetical protein
MKERWTNKECIRSHIPVQDIVCSFTEVLPVIRVIQIAVGHGRWNKPRWSWGGSHNDGRLSSQEQWINEGEILQ